MTIRLDNGGARGWVVTAFVTLVAVAAGCGNLAERGPYAVAYAPGGEMTVFLDGEVRFFDADAQHALGSIQTPVQIGGFGPFSPRFVASSDGTTVAIGANRTVQVYSVQQRKNVASIVVETDPAEARPIVGITLSPHGDLVAVSMDPDYTTEAPSLTVWRVADQTRVAAVVAPADRPKWLWRSGLAFSPDAGTLYGIGSYPIDESSMRSYVSAWNAETGDLVWETEGAPPTDPVEISVTVSSDGSMVATAGTSIHLWRASDGSLSSFDANIYTGFTSVALSPDGQDFVVTHGGMHSSPDPQVIGPDGAVIWAAPIDAPQSVCRSGVFSPDGTRVAAVCDLQVKIWNAQTGDLVRNLKVAGPVY